MPNLEIKYGDVICIQHPASGRYLASADKRYAHARSSSQQIIFAKKHYAHDCRWIVCELGGQAKEEKEGKTIDHGETFRIRHKDTDRYLHSHTDPSSPVTGEQEVTGYRDTRPDINDNWQIEFQNGGTWRQGKHFHLKHVATGKYLDSAIGASDKLDTNGEQEVACVSTKTYNASWKVVSAGRERLWKIADNWVVILNIVSAFASITGWSLVAIGSRLDQLTWTVVLGFLATTTVSVALVLLLVSGAIEFHQRFFSLHRRASTWWALRLLTWLAAALVGLLLWKLTPTVAERWVAPAFKWLLSH